MLFAAHFYLQHVGSNIASGIYKPNLDQSPVLEQPFQEAGSSPE